MSPLSIYSYVSPKLEVRPVPEKGGYGMFSVEPVDEGELLVVWGGELRTEDQIAGLQDGRNCQGLQVADGVYFSSIRDGDADDYVTHSCDPNA